ncbi:MAG: hypothetical protein COB04_07005 [Gammaproteobacteria bacterium]|nr:MAG: hypothetical protein COB04_07005 [Gammaproteobacteria bacterium]
MNPVENNNAARYAVGIDLGTTHCVLAWRALDQEAPETAIEVLPITQLGSPGSVVESQQLASLMYLTHPNELSEQALSLPWNSNSNSNVTGSLNQPLGSIAQNLGAKTPIRLVSSAKSWLGHTGVDCKEAFLPLDSVDEIDKVSPYEATVAYLCHLKNAWQHRFPDAPLAQQKLTITVPASFDPKARELTAEAAQEAGLNQAILLEEPQAAFYSWVFDNADTWRDQVQLGDVILVVDVGGGTTDLSLIEVKEDSGELSLERLAVGEHILLGGDNMDLALAYQVKAKVEAQGKTLEMWQINALTHGCRAAKEALLTDTDLQTVPIVVPSRGSRMMGGGLRAELTRDEVITALVEGFFPKAAVDEVPRSRPRSALSKKSLPFAQDAGITRHLAKFLSSQAPENATAFSNDPLGVNGNNPPAFLKPTAVLFNGGVFKAPILAQRVGENLNRWLEESARPAIKHLSSADLDYAVARGAAYYGTVREGNGVRIKGGTACAYYVGIESAMPAVPGMEPPLQAFCIAPFGLEEGSSAANSPEEFALLTGQSVEFRFFASKTRRDDQVGTVLESWSDDELMELPPISAKLDDLTGASGQGVTVTLQAGVTEVGTLKLEAVEVQGQRRWKIEFDVRDH